VPQASGEPVVSSEAGEQDLEAPLHSSLLDRIRRAAVRVVREISKSPGHRAIVRVITASTVVIRTDEMTAEIPARDHVVDVLALIAIEAREDERKRLEADVRNHLVAPESFGHTDDRGGVEAAAQVGTDSSDAPRAASDGFSKEISEVHRVVGRISIARFVFRTRNPVPPQPQVGPRHDQRVRGRQPHEMAIERRVDAADVVGQVFGNHPLIRPSRHVGVSEQLPELGAKHKKTRSRSSRTGRCRSSRANTPAAGVMNPKSRKRNRQSPWRRNQGPTSRTRQGPRARHWSRGQDSAARDAPHGCRCAHRR